MKTISEIYHNMFIGHAIVKDGKMFFRVRDVLEEAKKNGLENPEELLESEVKSGEMKIFEKDFIELDIGKEVCEMMKL